MKKTHKDILKVLSIDPLSEAEKITGNEDKNDKDTTRIGLALQIEKSKVLDRLLDDIRDTKFVSKLSEYLSIVQGFGFKIVYAEDFKADRRDEKMYILWHDDLSILLRFDTFTWGHESEGNVNGGNFYYNWVPHGGVNRWDLTSSGGFFSEDKAPVWVGDHDCREAIITKIKALFENGTFVKEWKDCAFPWLTHYVDHEKGSSKGSFEKYFEKTRAIISKLPLHVQICIGSYKH